MNARTAALAAGLIALAPTFAAGEAKAAACLTSDVSLTIGSTSYAPTRCADNVNQGSGPTAETASMQGQLALSSLTYLASSDGSSGVGLGGIGFSVTAPSTNSGNWNAAWFELVGSPNLPITIDFAVGLFGGNNGAVYLFDNVLLTSSPSTGTGTFDINFLNRGGQQPNLSHIILAGTDVGAPTSVPEPASLALFGLGLAGLGLATRRRQVCSV